MERRCALSTPRTLSQSIPGYIVYLDNATRLGKGTRTRYVYEARKFIEHVGDPALETMTAAMLLDWFGMLVAAGGAPGTISQKHAAVKRFLQYLAEYEESERAAKLVVRLDGLKVPKDLKPKRQAYALSAEEIEKLIEAAGKGFGGVGIRDRALVSFMAATGCRRAEVATVRLDQVNIAEREAEIIGKGEKARVVVFHQDCASDLAAWVEERKTCKVAPGCKTLFISARGTSLDLSTVGEIVAKAVKTAGFRRHIWPHILRHSAVTALLEHGMSLQNVAALAGHSRPSTTMGYFHPSTRGLKQDYDNAMGGTRYP